MTDVEFLHWLNGYFEITGCTEVGPEETKIIKEKLQSLFHKKTGKTNEGILPSPLMSYGSTMTGGSSGVVATNGSNAAGGAVGQTVGLQLAGRQPGGATTAMFGVANSTVAANHIYYTC